MTRRDAPDDESTAAGGGASAPRLSAVCAGRSRPIEREPVGDIRHALYFAVFEGGIRARLGCQRVDLEAVDACYATDDVIRCLKEIPRFLLYDRYLDDGRKEAELVLFNLFHDLGDDDSVCEVPIH
jgi:hypothetical protein